MLSLILRLKVGVYSILAAQNRLCKMARSFYAVMSYLPTPSDKYLVDKER